MWDCEAASFRHTFFLPRVSKGTGRFLISSPARYIYVKKKKHPRPHSSIDRPGMAECRHTPLGAAAGDLPSRPLGMCAMLSRAHAEDNFPTVLPLLHARRPTAASAIGAGWTSSRRPKQRGTTGLRHRDRPARPVATGELSSKAGSAGASCSWRRCTGRRRCRTIASGR